MPFDWEETIKASGAKFIGYQNHKQLLESPIIILKTNLSFLNTEYLLVINHNFHTL